MFRHLSPKVAIHEKHTQTTKIKQTSINSTPIIVYKINRKEPIDKHPVRREKGIKNMGSLPINQPILSIPASSTSVNKSIQVTRNKAQKNGNIFNDYYEQVPNPLVTVIHTKKEASLSGGSYHSESNFNGAKKIKSPKSTVADKCQPKPKNLVNTIINNNNDLKISFKSPGNAQANRSQYQEGKSDKRILSFGGKKMVVGKVMDDVEVGSKKSNDSSTGNHGPNSPPDNALCKISGPESMEYQQEKKEPCNENKSNEQTGKSKVLKRHLPRFIANGNIRSTPYLIKYKSDSENQVSDDNLTPKLLEKTHSILQQIQKQSKKDHQEERYSFNREQLFLSLKKRQERHSQLSKQLKKMGVHVQLKIITTQGERPFEVTFIKKIIECKKTSIYLVYHQKTNSLYCLKRIDLEDHRHQYVDNIIRQHKIHQFCSNPHIVKAFGTLLDTSHIYLLMEFMEGETLGMELKNQVLKHMSEQNINKTNNESNDSKILKINKIRNILYEIMLALAYLHEMDIIHHDIKPDNIFISHNIYKLGDFGSAVIHGSQEYVGTLDYAAPQILTRAPYDEKIDIWSLGCIAYELDVGRPPFFHISPQQTRRLISNGQYDRSLITDNQLRHVIDRMLQTNRKMRISARQLLKFQFFRKKGDDSEIS